jgi:riboflavin synthase
MERAVFSGIVEAVGQVVSIEGIPRVRGGAAAHRLVLDLAGIADGLAPGGSVAVNGVCLTLAALDRERAEFDVIPETWRRTNLARLEPGDDVNLERSLRIGDRLGGHFVQGHVDGVATIDRIDRTADEWRVWFAAADALKPYIVRKGSIALDGVSLTIADVDDARFCVALIPVTLQRTTFGGRAAGDLVNVETDILARLVVSRLEAMGADTVAPTERDARLYEKLRAGGFAP